MTEERKITVQRLEQTDLWTLRDKYGQHVYCYDCLAPLAPGDTIVRILVHTWQKPRLYHDRCFNRARARDPIPAAQDPAEENQK
jgi:hypothetical protein